MKTDQIATILNERTNVLPIGTIRKSEFRPLIGLESAEFQQPWYDMSWLHCSDVHGGEVCAALISGLIAPQTPAEHRHETHWLYMQSGPGTFRSEKIIGLHARDRN